MSRAVVTGITAGSSWELNLIDTSLIEDQVNRRTAILFEGGTLTNLKHVTQAIYYTGIYIFK